MSKDCFDKWESVTNTLKNVFFIIGSIGVILLIIILLPQLRSQIKSAKIESLEIAGIKLMLYNELNISERSKGEEEIEVSRPVEVAAELISYEGTFWVYLGATTPRGSKENWVTKNFNIVTVPKSGDNIVAITNVLKRAEKPKIEEGKWVKGEIQGLVKRGQKVKIIDIAEIPGTRNRSLWWAKVLSP